MTHRAILALAALVSGIGSTTAAAEDELGASLRGVMNENLRAYNAEDVDSTLRTIHSRSPEYDTTRAALVEQFQDLDVKAELVEFRTLGHDDEFVVARVKLKLVGSPGDAFQNNVTDNLILFHQEGGVWKLWSDEVLGGEVTR
jgi:hypothetical protein